MQIFLLPEKVMVTLQPQMLIIWLVLAETRDGSALKKKTKLLRRREGFGCCGGLAMVLLLCCVVEPDY